MLFHIYWLLILIQRIMNNDHWFVHKILKFMSFFSLLISSSLDYSLKTPFLFFFSLALWVLFWFLIWKVFHVYAWRCGIIHLDKLLNLFWVVVCTLFSLADILFALANIFSAFSILKSITFDREERRKSNCGVRFFSVSYQLWLLVSRDGSVSIWGVLPFMSQPCYHFYRCISNG